MPIWIVAQGIATEFPSKSEARKYIANFNKHATNVNKIRIVTASNKELALKKVINKKNPPLNKWIPAKAIKFLKGGVTQILQ